MGCATPQGLSSLSNDPQHPSINYSPGKQGTFSKHFFVTKSTKLSYFHSFLFFPSNNFFEFRSIKIWWNGETSPWFVVIWTGVRNSVLPLFLLFSNSFEFREESVLSFGRNFFFSSSDVLKATSGSVTYSFEECETSRCRKTRDKQLRKSIRNESAFLLGISIRDQCVLVRRTDRR